MDREKVENVASSLVREYLSRKGLKTTLQVMDEEMPRTDGSISNRNMLMKELHIEKLMKKNKDSESPLKTMLEVLGKYLLEKSENGCPVDGPMKDVSKSKQLMKSIDGFPTSNNPSIDLENTKQASYQSTSKKSLPLGNLESTNKVDLSSMSQTRANSAKVQTQGSIYPTQGNDLVIEDNLESETLVGSGKAGIMDQEESPDYIPPPRTQTRPRSSRQKGLSGPISSNLDDPGRRKYHRPRPLTAGNRGSQKLNLLNSGAKDEISSGAKDESNPSEIVTDKSRLKKTVIDSSASDNARLSSPINKRSGLTDNASVINNTSVVNNVDYLINEKRKTSIKDVLELESEKPKPAIRRQSSSETKHYDVDISSIAERPPTRGSSSTGRPTSSSSKTSNSSKVVGDVEIGDMDDLDEDVAKLDLGPRLPVYKPIQNTIDATPIDMNTAVNLKMLIFGSGTQCFNDEWRFQCFSFCDIPKLKYGIVQKKGGPCGVTASVQACMLQELLFGENKITKSRYSDPTREERTTCLAVGLSKIFWRAGQQHCAVVVIPSGRSQFQGATNRYKPDEVTETLMVNRFKSYEELQSFMTQCISQFEVDGGSGVMLALYSAILSRTVDLVKRDMDEPMGKLMGAHGYCTQEMVNLLLTGRAVSNVFNDVMELDSGDGSDAVILKGLNNRSDIGLLSLFEHYKSCQVGTYYKTPKYPIWVICSESHFSVLFSIKKELINDWKAERRFDLFYYDGLARQQEEIKLTIDTTNRFYQPPSEDELVPPLNLCIRTKWKDAEIDWNSTEPLL